MKKVYNYKVKTGRPSLGERQAYNLHLPTHLHTALKQLSVVTGRPMNTEAQDAISEYLARKAQLLEEAKKPAAL